MHTTRFILHAGIHHHATSRLGLGQRLRSSVSRGHRVSETGTSRFGEGEIIPARNDLLVGALLYLCLAKMSLFSRMNDFAAELLGAERTGKYSPIEVAQWIED
jgi:hypothetical protein